MSTEQPPGPHGNGYRKGPVLLRGGQVPRTTSDQRLLASGNEPDWVHGDPWRVMRIQSEFVEGFGALAEVEPAVSVFLSLIHISEPTRRTPLYSSAASDVDKRQPDWVHGDPWRVMRIQSEFVEGFGALAEVGPAVSVFGSARTKPDEPEYALAVAVGAALVQAGYAVITGGGPGIMEATNRGASEAGGLSIGLG